MSLESIKYQNGAAVKSDRKKAWIVLLAAKRGNALYDLHDRNQVFVEGALIDSGRHSVEIDVFERGHIVTGFCVYTDLCSAQVVCWNFEGQKRDGLCDLSPTIREVKVNPKYHVADGKIWNGGGYGIPTYGDGAVYTKIRVGKEVSSRQKY